MAAARVALTDGTRAALREPRVEGSVMTARSVSECEGAACATLMSRRSLPLASIAGAEVIDARPPPLARVDVDFGLPAVMIPVGVGVEAGTAGASVGARFASRSGFGAGLRVIGATSWSLSNTSVVRAHANGIFFDATALYRARPSGDDRRGLGVDLALGLSYGTFEWSPGHSAYSGDCPLVSLSCMATVTEAYTPPPQGFSTGERIGPVASVGLDWRSRAFVGGISAQYRALTYIGPNPIAAEPTVLHLLTAQLHLGFGFEL